MEYNTHRYELNLKDLFFSILHKWRKVLLIAVLAAVIFGGYKSISLLRNVMDAEKIEKSRAKYEESLEAYQNEKENISAEIDRINTDIERQEEYLSNSIRLNMNAYSFWEGRILLYVDTGYQIMPDASYQNTDKTGSILLAYQNAVTSNGFLDEIAESNDISPEYFRELVSAAIDPETSNVLTIKIQHPEKEVVQSLTDEFMNKLNKQTKQLQKKFGEYTATVVDDDVYFRIDRTLADSQKEERSKITSLNEKLADAKAALSELEAPEKPVTSKRAALKSAIKFAVLGGALGLILAIFVLCLLFIASDKLYSAQALEDRCGVRVLGVLGTKKKIGKIDKMINRWEGRHSPQPGQFDLFAANVGNYAGKQAKNLLVTGDTDEQLVQQVAAELNSRLPDIQVTNGGVLLQNAEALKLLPEADGVVLVARCNRSHYNIINREIEKINDISKVLGCAVID